MNKKIGNGRTGITPMGDQRWHASVRMSQVTLLDEEAKPRGLTRSEVFLVALSLGIDQLMAQRLAGDEAQKLRTSTKKPKAAKPSLRKPKAAKPDADKQIVASEIALLDDEPAPSKPKLSAIDQSFVDLKETPKILKVAAAEDMDDLLAQVLSDEPSSSPSEQVSDTVPPSEPIESEEPREGLLVCRCDGPTSNPFSEVCAECGGA